MSRSQSKQFGIVQVGPMRFAISIAHLSEVFHARNPQPLPQKSEFLRGGIELRGRLVPVLNLQSFTALTQDAPSAEMGVIVECGSRHLAIFVDGIVGICTIDPDDIQEMSPQELENVGLFSEFFRYEKDYISIVDVEKVMSLQGVYTSPRPTVEKQVSVKAHAPVLTFSAGGALFSVPAVEVYAAIPKRVIEQSAITMGPVLGEITYHNRRIPVLCPIQIFGLGSSTRTNASEVVAFRFPGNLVLGFAVDAIQKIGAVTTGARAELSDWHGRHSFIKDIMIQDDDTQVFALSIDSLYASADLCEIAKLSELEVTKTPVEKLKTYGERNIIYEKIRYLVVEAGNRVAVPLSEVNRIIAVPEEITVTVESSSGFGGYFAKSGQSIGLFDLSACHGHPHETTNHSKVLLTGSAARQSGFQVARVIGIELSEWREIQPKTAHGTAPALVQLGNGDTATVLPICSLTETLNMQTAKRPTNESLSV